MLRGVLAALGSNLSFLQMVLFLIGPCFLWNRVWRPWSWARNRVPCLDQGRWPAPSGEVTVRRPMIYVPILIYGHMLWLLTEWSRSYIIVIGWEAWSFRSSEKSHWFSTLRGARWGGSGIWLEWTPPCWGDLTPGGATSKDAWKKRKVIDAWMDF